MKQFMDADFLLENETAKHLFHSFAENMPICDYHCHLSPREIYENRPYKNISELWLSGDHYKWRAMRTCGFCEELCTGTAAPEEKFSAFAVTLGYAPGNPLYHWAHLELQKFFGIYTPLNKKTAGEIYYRANEKMSAGEFRPQTLITKSNVKYICTTDDPADSLEYHFKLRDIPGFDCKVLPTFRPDKALSIENPDFKEYIGKLGESAGIKIESVNDVIAALDSRIEFFASAGCRVSDHSFGRVPYFPASDDEINSIFTRKMSGEDISAVDAEKYKTKVFKALGEKYHEKDWSAEIHIGALRNNSSRMFADIGADTGFDSVDDGEVMAKLSRLLDSLDRESKLPKTVLFNLNSKDNEALAAMAGNFQSAEAECKIQFGPAWWFLDTIDGMTSQLKTLGNLSLLGKFIGMETDSRSFTSYARHDYFRRILCNLLGYWVENGMFENDEENLREIIEGICFNNAVKYFGF